MEEGVRRTMTTKAALFVLLCVLSICSAEVCHITDPIQRQECATVHLMHGATSQVRQSILRQLCEAGHRHVLLKGASPSQFQSLPTSPRRAEQFAVLYIQRDDFSEKVIWKSGEAADIMCNDNWFVDEEVKLTNGYRWYSYGLPLWPMMNQTLAKKKQGLLSRKKKVEWPNYAIGTPFYLVPGEIYNSRDPNLAIQKRFAGDFAPGPLNNGQFSFSKPDYFKEKVTNLYRLLFLDQMGYARKDINSDFESYPNWLQPLVQSSLKPMLESFLESQTPKRGQSAICPDELFIFFHQAPCTASTSCLLLNEFQLILKVVGCPDTSVVVGYGTSGDVAVEEIIPTKILKKSESAPSSHVGPAPKSAASCNNCQLQIVGGILALLVVFQLWI